MTRIDAGAARLALTATVALGFLVALIEPAVAPAADRVIRTRAGLVTSVGPLRPTDAGVSRLKTLFGAATAVVQRGNSCIVRFSRTRITITLANFGADGSACDAGRAQSAVVNGRAWRTQRGLRVEDRFSRMRQLYPGSRRRNGRWQLQTAPLFGLTVATLEVSVAGGRVSRIQAYLGGAGE